MKITYLKYFLVFFSNFLFLSAWAQALPDAYTTDWSFAGYNGDIPEPTDILTPSGLDKTGATDMSDIVNAAVTAQNGKSNGGVVYLPEGTYLFRKPLSLKSNVTLRGASADKTRLRFDLSGDNDPILIKGSLPSTTNNPEQRLGVSAARGSKVITLENTCLSNVTKGKMVMLYRQPGIHAYPGDSWAQTANSMQMLHVEQAKGKEVTFVEQLRSDFKVSDAACIRVVSSIRNVGLEDFSLTCVNKQYSGEDPSSNNIAIDYADSCWITGVESAYSNSAHVNIRRSSNIQISGCYFHHAHGWGGGGSGYGVCLTGGAGQVLVANCIFDSLRHAMLIQGFANGNVFAYNYSARTHRTDASPYDAAGDIILHGNYAHSNLFQYNVANTLSIDNPHGANGPRNVFLRNRLTRYGIYILEQRSNNDYAKQQLDAGVQNDSTVLIANEVTRAKQYVSSTYSYGDYRIFSGSKGNIETGNRQQGSVVSGNASNADAYRSFYNLNKPLFWDVSDDWFAIGGSQIGATIPAVKRYEGSSPKTDSRKKLFSGCTSAKPVVVSSRTYHVGDTVFPLSVNGVHLKWYTTAHGGTGSATAPVQQTSTAGVQTFYVSQTQDGCAESERAAITVTVLEKETTTPCTSAKPVVSNQTCNVGDAAPPLSAVGEQLRWYTVAHGGTGSATAPVPLTSTAGVQTFYVSQTESGCTESERAAITVTVSEKKEETPTEISPNEAAVKIFPNPFSDALHVEVNDNAEINLHSMDGAMMLRLHIGGEGWINTSQLPEGAYVLKVQGKRVSESRVVVLARGKM
jgi:hypothetical protein